MAKEIKLKAMPKKEEKKETKDLILKFVGKKTNDGDKVIAINRKKVERVNQVAVEMIELVLASGRKTIMPEADLKGYLK